MRKAISVILAIALVFIIASCSNSAPQPAAEYKGTFYGWDSNDPGLWVKTAKRASGGGYSLELSFDKGIISLTVDGEKIHSYAIKDDSGSLVGKTKVSSIILQSLSNGKEYTVEWTLPAVNGTAVSADGWEVDRTAPKAFAIAGGKVSLTTTDANIADDAADRFNRCYERC